ncbi:MAG: MerR family transcriptional regulator [Vicinamibacteria bacterium]
MDRQIPNKLFFKIGEVCEITDTQPYVLRYWESEFPALAPAKNSSGQRIYRRKDIETVLRIKQLLYEEGFTIAGAKKRLEAEMAGRGPTPSSMAGDAVAEDKPTMAADPAAAAPSPEPAAAPDPAEDKTRAVLVEVRAQLREMLAILDKGDRSAP